MINMKIVRSVSLVVQSELQIIFRKWFYLRMCSDSFFLPNVSRILCVSFIVKHLPSLKKRSHTQKSCKKMPDVIQCPWIFFGFCGLLQGWTGRPLFLFVLVFTLQYIFHTPAFLLFFIFSFIFFPICTWKISIYNLRELTEPQSNAI